MSKYASTMSRRSLIPDTVVATARAQSGCGEPCCPRERLADMCEDIHDLVRFRRVVTDGGEDQPPVAINELAPGTVRVPLSKLFEAGIRHLTLRGRQDRFRRLALAHPATANMDPTR